MAEREDISDEAIYARHDEVLRKMREKWAKIAQLKSDLKRPSNTNSGGGNGYGNINKILIPQSHSQMLPAPLTSSSLTSDHCSIVSSPYSSSDMIIDNYDNRQSSLGDRLSSISAYKCNTGLNDYGSSSKTSARTEAVGGGFVVGMDSNHHHRHRHHQQQQKQHKQQQQQQQLHK